MTVSITLFAIFTALMDNAEIFIRQLFFKDYDGRLYFSVTLQKDPDSGETVSDTLVLIHNSDLFEQLRSHALQSFQTKYRYDETDNRGEYYNHRIMACFVDEAEYRSLFEGDPPVSYEALVNSGGFVYVPEKMDPEDTLAPEEAWKLDFRSDAEAGKVALYTEYREEPTEQEMQDPNFVWPDPELRLHEFPVCAVSERSEYSEMRLGDTLIMGQILVGSLESYIAIIEDWCGESYIDITLSCQMSNEAERANYQKILSFFRAHSKCITLYDDNYAGLLMVQKVLAAVRAGVLFLNCIIALAALVNLLNIISTGIANRRSEMASLQCVGMTDGQLLRMTLAECLQYVMKAALISSVICGLVIFGCRQLLFPLLMEISFGENWILHVNTKEGNILMDLLKLNSAAIFARIALASAVAFAAGAAASAAMLRAQGKQSLAERVRNAE